MSSQRHIDGKGRASIMVTRSEGEIIACDGNRAAALGALLCKVDVVGVFPVTPQTQIIEHLSRFIADGTLDAEMVEVEGETSALGVCMGASAAGARVFTATSGSGLAFMYDGYNMAGRIGFPIVMVNACREDFPAVACGEQDVMGQLDAGWIHIHLESCQEILDSTIMAYKLAEDPQILRPVLVCYDGWYLSYASERVEIPPGEEVIRFAPPLSKLRPRLDPDEPMTFHTLGTRELAEVRYKQQAAMEKAKGKIDEIDRDFKNIFGRGYGGQIEEYRTEDAEILMMTLGSCTGTARVAVDKKRDEGLKVGLVKVRLFRPFPKEKLVEVARGKKGIGIVDRNVCFGWDCGHLFMESRAALYDSGTNIPLVNFIDGLVGADITIEHIDRAIDMTYKASQGKPVKEVTWLMLE